MSATKQLFEVGETRLEEQDLKAYGFRTGLFYVTHTYITFSFFLSNSMRHIVDSLTNIKQWSAGKSKRNGNRGDLVVTAFQIRMFVDALKQFLLLNDHFSWSERFLGRHPALVSKSCIKYNNLQFLQRICHYARASNLLIHSFIKCTGVFVLSTFHHINKRVEGSKVLKSSRSRKARVK